MHIDPKKCVACGNCIAVCPMNAIAVDPRSNRARIDPDECVECGACFRMSTENLNPVLVRSVRRLAGIFRFRFEAEPDVCPTTAFVMDELSWPRSLRRVFSDPLVAHESTGIQGRGTEEVKTNDVSHRIGTGQVGYVVEFGRPGVGVRLREIEVMTRELAALGVSFEERNPVSSLMTDEGGSLPPEVLGEKVLSAIVELRTPMDRVATVLETVTRVSKQIDTVVAVGVSTRCDSEGEDPTLAPLLEELGYEFERAKTNMGLGRATNPEAGGTRRTHTGAAPRTDAFPRREARG